MVAQAFLQLANLHLVHLAGDFLAVAGDKGHRGAFFQKGDGTCNASLLKGGFFCQNFNDGCCMRVAHSVSFLG